MKSESKTSEQIFPASEIQKMFWLTCQANPESPAYNIASLLSIKGAFNTEVFKKSLEIIISRHHIFRTHFRLENNDLIQVVISEIDLKITDTDLTSLSSAGREQKLTSILEHDVNQKFEMGDAPLFRIHLIKIAEMEYVLSIVMHHIIYDMESKYIFTRELSGIYTHLLKNESVIKLEAAAQYTDFSIRQKEIILKNGYTEKIDFWKNSLNGYSGYLNLPLDFQRPQWMSGLGEQLFFELNNEFVSQLRELSKKNSVNLFTTMLAIYFLLLYRLSGQNDIIAGVPLTNRRNDDDKEMIGCFVNIMPLPVTISGEQSFNETVKLVRNAMLGAHRNQEVPFSLIVKEIQPRRDGGYNPLFQAGFTFEQPMELDLPGLEINTLLPCRHGAQLDVFMILWEHKDVIRGFLEYSNDVFNRKTAENIIDCYRSLAGEVILKPDLSIDYLQMISPTDRYKILNEWNNTCRDYDLSIPLHALFEKQSASFPDRTAVVFREQSLTYRELNEKANILAHRLIKDGAGPDKIIGVYMERSLEMVISLYAIIKAGSAYLPLSPELPVMRINFMVEDAEPVMILAQHHLKEKLADKNQPILFIDNTLKDINETDISNPGIKLKNDNLAYCIYTSGSTGKPKGIMVPHKGICNRLLWMQEYFNINENDRILQKTPFDFDVSVWEFFWPLINGATLIVAEPGGHRDSSYLANIISDENITVIHFVPAMLDIFLREPEIYKCSSLRYVICSGEVLPYQLQERFFNTFNCGLYNLYGPTEASVDVTYWKCSMDYEKKVVPIGFPVANTQMYILNEALQTVPPGVQGNLYIGGIQLARGYLNREELTRECFIKSPFCITSDEYLYNTGDCARWLPDGAIEYLGRSDFQIKLHGLRIEPGEIEFAIEQNPAIAQSVVTAFGNGESKRLVAYYKLKSGSNIDMNELKNSLREIFSPAVVPSIFMELQSFPMTPSGKIDRKALPAPVITNSSDNIPINPGKIEKEILSIWQEYLKIQNIGLHDNFFDIGGHSLLLTLINHKIREVFGINITMVDMFRYPTIASISEFLRNNGNEDIRFEGLSDRSRNRQEALLRIKNKNRVPV